MASVDKRAAKRRRTCCIGTVALAPSIAPIEVMVRNISKSGAAVRIMDSRHLPTPFQLLVRSAGIARNAKIVWKNGPDVGVVFEDTAA